MSLLKRIVGAYEKTGGDSGPLGGPKELLFGVKKGFDATTGAIADAATPLRDKADTVVQPQVDKAINKVNNFGNTSTGQKLQNKLNILRK